MDSNLNSKDYEKDYLNSNNRPLLRNENGGGTCFARCCTTGSSEIPSGEGSITGEWVHAGQRHEPQHCRYSADRDKPILRVQCDGLTRLRRGER